jgi:hypothetical protein
MKIYTKTVREGELLGPVDWEYDFRQHFDCMGTTAERKDEACRRAIQLLREVEEANNTGVQVFLCHGFLWRDVISVGMYDGWPFWKPTPAMLCSGTLGAEWHFFYDLQQVRKVILNCGEEFMETGLYRNCHLPKGHEGPHRA